ncbi:hypothetical protein KDRO_D07480 [Kluyveromyces lactis]|nr:hypothetical protein KDRO_D07480 [Kluyveromyces lactis]
MCLELENNLNDYFKACAYAYYSDYDNFIKYYDNEELFDEDDLNFHLCIGIRNSYNFAVKMENSGLKLTAGILSSISARYVMSNKVCDFNFKYLPSNIWYPNVPSKETCIYLLEKDARYSLVVKTICVLLGWEDICKKCDKICNEYSMFLSVILDREDFCKGNNIYEYKIEENKTILKKVKLEDKILSKKFINDNREFIIDTFFMYNFTRIQQNLEQIIDDSLYTYIDYSQNIEFGPMDCSSIDKSVYYNMVSYKPYLDISVNTVEFNFLNSIYVLKHHKEYPDDLCKKAVLNLLVNDIYDQYYLELYLPFYFYTYKTLNTHILEKLLIDFPDKKYSILVNYAIMNKIPPSPEYMNADIDLINIAYASGSLKFYNYMMEMAKRNGQVFKHMDFENEKYIMKSYKYEDVDFDNLHKNNGHPLLLRTTHLNFP